jgi:hypothetical protein
MMCLETSDEATVAFYKMRGFVERGDSLSIDGPSGNHQAIMTCMSKS